MQLGSFFSSDYAAARARFRAAVEAAGGTWQPYPIAARGPRDEELSIDVANFGKAAAERVVVVSSGLHGPEGLFGSALQTAWLSSRKQSALPDGMRMLLLHALNPFGFAWGRRWNESNVDLNRNFLLPGQEYKGCPPRYAHLDRLLNPRSLPSRWAPFALRIALPVLRNGMAALAQTIPVGQYDFPQGLFYGGAGPEETHCILAANMTDWLGPSREVLHIDLHTGLGKWGTYQLLVDAPPEDERVKRMVARFGERNVSPNRLAEGPGKSGVVYAARGTWEQWCLARFANRDYQFATAEFGTHSGVRVIAALRAENRAYHYGGKLDPAYDWTRAAVVEAFAPARPQWRERVLEQGLEIIDRAIMEK
jgi:hypothetical protein